MLDVVVTDPCELDRERLARELRSSGWVVRECADGRALKDLVGRRRPDLVVLELRLEDGPSRGIIEWLRSTHPEVKVAVVTNQASIATAVRCATLGIRGYYRKGAATGQLLGREADNDAADDAVPPGPMRLDRAMWEYIQRVVDEAGSITKAAELLRMDRSSLRRILNKNAPLS